MNFISTFDELNKLYEEKQVKPNCDRRLKAKSSDGTMSVDTSTLGESAIGSSNVTADQQYHLVSVFASYKDADFNQTDRQIYYNDADNESEGFHAEAEYVYSGTLPEITTKLNDMNDKCDFGDIYVSTVENPDDCLFVAGHTDPSTENFVDAACVFINKLFNNNEPFMKQFDNDQSRSNTDELTEAAEEEEIEIVDDEAPVEEVPAEEPVVEDEPRQLICECDKCGALVIKDEADIVVDEESDLVNVEDECQFCEEARGYKIVGVVAPYEVAEEEPVEDAVVEDEFVEESVEETLKETYYACAEIDGEERRFPFENREDARKYIATIRSGEAPEFKGKKIGSVWTEGLEDSDGEKPLKETYYACAEIEGEERRFPFDDRESARKYAADIRDGKRPEFKGKKIGSTWTEGLKDSDSEKPLNETLSLKSSSKQLNDLATAIHNGLSKSITNFDRNMIISTFAGKDSMGSGEHIVIATVKNRVNKLPEGTLERLKKQALKYLSAAEAEAEIANTKYENGVNYVILDNIKFADTVSADNEEKLDELLDIKPSISLSLDGGQGNDVDVL